MTWRLPRICGDLQMYMKCHIDLYSGENRVVIIGLGFGGFFCGYNIIRVYTRGGLYRDM